MTKHELHSIDDWFDGLLDDEPEEKPPEEELSWEKAHLYSPAQIEELERLWVPKDRADKAFRFLDRFGRRLILGGAIAAFFVYQATQPIYAPMKDGPREALRAAAAPNVIAAAKQMIDAYYDNPQSMTLAADKDVPGGFWLSMRSFSGEQRISTDLAVMKNDQRELEPSTAYSLEVEVSDCNQQAEICGGEHNDAEQIDIYNYDDGGETPVWEVTNKLWVSANQAWTPAIDSYFENAKLGTGSLAVQESVHTASVFSAVAETYVEQSLAEGLEPPKKAKGNT